MKPSALVLAAALLFPACAPDPYGIHPEALKVEKGVMGITSLDVDQDRVERGDYVLLEGTPYPEGGIMHRPFYLDEIPLTPALGNAILARKARWADVFGLLSRGAVGEGSEGRLIPRVAPVELTEGERRVIELENADREFIARQIISSLRVPEWEANAIHRVFAYARYQITPEGVWIEKEPGNWIVKGGREYQDRMMRRDPIPVRSEPRAGLADETTDEFYAQPVVVEPVVVTPVREVSGPASPRMIEEPAPALRPARPTTTIVEQPAVMIEEPAPSIR